jgi:hypothetical protein
MDDNNPIGGLDLNQPTDGDCIYGRSRRKNYKAERETCNIFAKNETSSVRGG